MKRIWIGIALLAVVLVSGCLASHFMEHHHMSIAEDLDRAAQLALEDQWEGALSITARARENWQKKRPITACFAEHEPLDEVDETFARLEIYAAVREEISFGSECAGLAEKLRALAQCHKFTFWNLM